MIIWGSRATTAFVTAQPFVCAHCRREVVQRLFRIRKWFTLFFIPLFPYSTQHVYACSYCGRETLINTEDAERFTADAAALDPRRSG